MIKGSFKWVLTMGTLLLFLMIAIFLCVSGGKKDNYINDQYEVIEQNEPPQSNLPYEIGYGENTLGVGPGLVPGGDNEIISWT